MRGELLVRWCDLSVAGFHVDSWNGKGMLIVQLVRNVDISTGAGKWSGTMRWRVMLMLKDIRA